MKKLILLSLFCLLLSLAVALPVTRTEAQSIAIAWMQQINATNPVSEIKAVASPDNPGLIDWYAINFDRGGFILVSSEDKALPILGYDTSGAFVDTNMPENLAWFVNQMHTEISALRATPALATNPGWQAIRNGNYAGYLPDRDVPPLLATLWDQGWPFNSLCPADNSGPGNHVYAGCGATTMAQIMKFWAYPVHGVGSHTYTAGTYGPQTANFAATTYNYGGMPNSLYYSPNTAISTLMYHCGVALNMDYGPDGSGSLASDVRPAFVNYFAYETSAQTVYRYSYAATAWDALMRNDLDNTRPIFYFGTDTTYGGHAFVVDGYQGTTMFHINWGWSGSSNGYFVLSNLNPGMYQFNSNQGACIGLQPTVGVTPPSNLTATADAGNNVFLQWQSPVSRALTGFTVYRDDVYVGAVADPLNTQYYDINLDPGTYNYYVVANFSQGDSGPSNIAPVTIYPNPVMNYQDSFEAYADFTSEVSPWFVYDRDLALTRTLDDYDFPGEGTAMSFIVFDPASVTPPLTEFNSDFGPKLMVCLPADSVANNDWICSPNWHTGNIAKVRFWAKSAWTDGGLAKIKVGMSTSAPVPETMSIISGDVPLEVPATWTRFEYNFYQNLYSNIFVGVQCVSDNGSALLLDRFQLWTSYVANQDDNTPVATSNGISVSPNPFSSTATISWQQKSAEQVTLKIFDLKGRLVKTLSDNLIPAGKQNLTWDGTDNRDRKVASGIYFCHLSGPSGYKSTARLVFLK